MFPGSFPGKGIVIAGLAGLAGAAVSVAAGSASAQPPDRDTPSPEPAQVVRVAEGIYRIGALQLDRDRETVTAPGHINMDRGVLEVVACTPGGKVHESLLVLDVEPYHLQVALLLLGLEKGRPVEHPGEGQAPQGDSVVVWVEWEDPETPDKTVRARVEDLVWNAVEERPMRRTPWIFVGSEIRDGIFRAQVEGSLITTYNDPSTILDNPLSTGADDTFYTVSERRVPPRDTPVHVEFRPAHDAGKRGD